MFVGTTDGEVCMYQIRVDQKQHEVCVFFFFCRSLLRGVHFPISSLVVVVASNKQSRMDFSR